MPQLEPRLQRRYVQLVKEHLQAATPLAAGPAALPRLTTAFASTQAAWRFFANDTVTLPLLIEPLRAAGRQALLDSSAQYALLIHDWSILNYHRHTAKADQILFSQGSDRGYELASALLARLPGGEGERWRCLLVRLSGRHMKQGVAFTLPALLAGLWVLLAMTEVLQHYDLNEIQRLASAILPKPT